MSLFPNLHTVQIEASRQLLCSSMMERIFEGIFGGWSYPPICEIFIPSPCGVLVSSCPHVRHVGVTPCVSTSEWRWPFLLCCQPHLEYLGNVGDISGLPNIFSSTSSLLFLVWLFYFILFSSNCGQLSKPSHNPVHYTLFDNNKQNFLKHLHVGEYGLPWDDHVEDSGI